MPFHSTIYASTSAHLVLVVGCSDATGYGFAVIYVNSSIEKVETVGAFFLQCRNSCFWEFPTPGRAFEVVNKSGVERDVGMNWPSTLYGDLFLLKSFKDIVLSN